MRSSKAGQQLRLQEVTFVRRDRLPLDVEVLRLEELLRPPFHENTTKPTRAHFHTLLLIEAGVSVHHVDFEEERMGPGHLLAIPKGHVQAFDPARVISGYLALFTADFLEHCSLHARRLVLASQVFLRAGVHLHLGQTSLTRVQRAFATLADHASPVSSNRFASEALISAFSLLIFTVAGLPETAVAVVAQMPDDELVVQFQALLEARFAVSRQASSYARALHVSLRTLDRRLVTTQGHTARQAISARVVLEAKRMLTQLDLPIKNIAYELGFSEAQNFTRFFRMQTGLSPQAFRSSLNAKADD